MSACPYPRSGPHACPREAPRGDRQECLSYTDVAMWTPEQYERFKTERAQPLHDLLAMVERRPRMRVVDLGCGTGELTRTRHEQLGAAETVGIDSSETMLLKSGHFGGEMLRFQHGTVEA